MSAVPTRGYFGSGFSAPRFVTGAVLTCDAGVAARRHEHEELGKPTWVAVCTVFAGGRHGDRAKCEPPLEVEPLERV